MSKVKIRLANGAFCTLPEAAEAKTGPRKKMTPKKKMHVFSENSGLLARLAGPRFRQISAKFHMLSVQVFALRPIMGAKRGAPGTFWRQKRSFSELVRNISAILGSWPGNGREKRPIA